MKAFVWSHLFSTYVSKERFFNSPPPRKHMYTLRVTVTAIGLFQKIILNTVAHRYLLKNMTQMLQVNKNSNIKYNKIQVRFN